MVLKWSILETALKMYKYESYYHRAPVNEIPSKSLAD